jgi:DMSO/TMAO reductase YedYZ molybdopterin-dependent catalytic subunit
VGLFTLGTPVRQLFSFVAPGPRQPGFPVNGTEPEVTPVPQFYVNGKNVTDPLLLVQDWQLSITGLVRNPLTLTYAQLLAMPRTNLYATLRCVDNPVDGHLMSTSYWSGVRLADLLALAQPLSQARAVVFRAADQFAEPFALAEPSYESILLAYAMNGETLPQAHGAPLRVLLPGWYGFRNVKWLQELEVVAGPVNGYWEQNGWQAQMIHPVARIDSIQRLDATRMLVAGVAFGGLGGVSEVQVRIDTGPWAATELNTPALSAYTWVQWRVLLPIQTQQFHLTARMIDGFGIPQEEQQQNPYPHGSSGLHTIEVKF